MSLGHLQLRGSVWLPLIRTWVRLSNRAWDRFSILPLACRDWVAGRIVSGALAAAYKATVEARVRQEYHS